MLDLFIWSQVSWCSFKLSLAINSNDVLVHWIEEQNRISHIVEISIPSSNTPLFSKMILYSCCDTSGPLGLEQCDKKWLAVLVVCLYAQEARSLTPRSRKKRLLVYICCFTSETHLLLFFFFFFFFFQKKILPKFK